MSVERDPAAGESEVTIDESLNRLTERHETLTQTGELLTADVRALADDMKNLHELARRDGENIRAIARISELRHHRLERLEGGE
jgi:archaellum component FlaC